MREHVLLDKAYEYENVPKELRPNNCYYDRADGLWRVKGTKSIMMVSDYAQKPQSKKCDIETGEDQKGE